MAEAQRRKIISENPYTNFKVPSMKNKKGFLSREQVNKLKELRYTLPHAENKVLLSFLFCVATGLRFSDFISLKNNHIKDGWIKKNMIKTGLDVEIPLTLFGGIAQEIYDKYDGNIEKLTKNIGPNAFVNKTLKGIFTKIGIDNKQSKFSFHTSRHTFASLLLQEGFNVTTVQKMLGHTKLSTTQIYAEVNKDTIKQDMERVKSKNSLK